MCRRGLQRRSCATRLTFQDMVKLNPYPGHELNKVECIGHVQKRVGARLRSYKAEHKEVLSAGKTSQQNNEYSAKLLWDDYPW